jgi:ferredoxin-thioredoxin reductase catalytic subunit
MNTTEKLQTLIPHWLEHNEEHADEFRRWAEQDATVASADLRAAAEAMKQVNRALAAALEKLGGTTSQPHSH